MNFELYSSAESPSSPLVLKGGVGQATGLSRMWQGFSPQQGLMWVRSNDLSRSAYGIEPKTLKTSVCRIDKVQAEGDLEEKTGQSTRLQF